MVFIWHLAVLRAVWPARAPPGAPRGDFCPGHRASSSDRRTISSRYPGSACALPFIQTSPSHSRRPPHRGRTMTVPPGTGLRTPPAGATPWLRQPSAP